MVGPGQPSGDQMIHPPPIQHMGDANQALEEEDEEDNPMFTPRRSNEHKATVAVGPDGRQALSPSAEPPNKMSKPAEQLTDGDRNMLGTDQAGIQQNIHHNGGGGRFPRGTRVHKRQQASEEPRVMRRLKNVRCSTRTAGGQDS